MNEAEPRRLLAGVCGGG